MIEKKDKQYVCSVKLTSLCKQLSPALTGVAAAHKKYRVFRHP